MKAKFLMFATAAIALLSAGSVFAQEATPDQWSSSGTPKTRAEVVAELAQARKDGTIRFASAGYIERLGAVRTRAELRSEVEIARDTGELAAINAEVNTYRASPALLIAGPRRPRVQ